MVLRLQLLHVAVGLAVVQAGIVSTPKLNSVVLLSGEPVTLTLNVPVGVEDPVEIISVFWQFEFDGGVQEELLFCQLKVMPDGVGVVTPVCGFINDVERDTFSVSPAE